MLLEHIRVIHLIYVIAGKYKNMLRLIAVHERHVLIYSICRTQIPLAAASRNVRRKHIYAACVSVKIPRLSRTDICIQLKRLVLRQNSDSVDVRICAVRQRKVYDPVFAAERHRRLCHTVCKHAETAPLPAGKQHGYQLFLSHSVHPHK